MYVTYVRAALEKIPLLSYCKVLKTGTHFLANVLRHSGHWFY